MQSEAIKLFLAQSHTEGNILLQDAIHKKNVVFWDNVLITAATENQAEIYRTLIHDRVKRKYIPSSCRYFALPDKNGVRIGSGGATVYALVKLLEACNGDINQLIGQRNIILHSGGAAKRMPHSAPWGKLFSLSGNFIGDDITNPPGTVFDDLMTAMAGIPSRMNNGVFVIAADAFFRFNHTQFDINTPDAIAFSIKAPVEVGVNHGVFMDRGGLCRAIPS
jgi:fucokinase